MKTIFIYGYYGSQNFGDDLLSLSIVSATIRRFPNSKVLLRNYGKIAALETFGDQVQCSNLETYLLDTGKSKGMRVSRYLWEYWKTLDQCDAFILGGGNVFIDPEARKATFLLWIICLFCKTRGIPIYGIGLGTGKLKTRLGRFLAQSVVKTMDFVNFRDPSAVSELNIPPQLRNSTSQTSADLAFSLPADYWPHWKPGETSQQQTIGVSMVGYLFESNWKQRPNEGPYRIFYSLLTWIERRIREKEKVVLISCQNMELSNGTQYGDLFILEQLNEELTRRGLERLPILQAQANVESMLAAFGPLKFLVAGRFHALVMASFRGIPFIGIAHSTKISEFCSSFGMPSMEMENLKQEWLEENYRLSKSVTPSQKTVESASQLVHTALNQLFDRIEQHVQEGS